MEKLLTIAGCTTEKGKADANAQRPTHGVGNFYITGISKKVPIKDLFNFLEDAF